ncbi:hypothetical protein P2318_24675 [Myxococcaceae bacterium GXIMD 01537]
MPSPDEVIEQPSREEALRQQPTSADWAQLVRQVVQTAEGAAHRAESAAHRVEAPILAQAQAAAQDAKAAAAQAQEALATLQGTLKAADAQKAQTQRASWMGVAQEVLKLPMLVLSLFLALAGSKSCLGMRFGDVAELPGGIKFHSQQKLVELSAEKDQTKAQLAEVQAQFATLQEHLRTPSKGIDASPIVALSAQSALVEDTVSPETAALARVSDEGGAPALALKDGQGVIWIGNYKDGRWSRVQLSKPNHSKFDEAPDAIDAGMEFSVIGNLVLRADWPGDGADYFRGVKMNGVVPAGTRVRALQAPRKWERGALEQYWLKVEVIDPVKLSER